MTKDVFAKLTLKGRREYEHARVNMLKQQLRTWDVWDDKILDLFYRIPREDFVPLEYKSLAFADMNIPIEHSHQTMMKPQEEAKVLQDLHIAPSDRILVIGADSGYLLTLLSQLGKQVLYYDNDIELFDALKNKLSHLKINHFENIEMHVGSLLNGWQEKAPFDVIILTGSLPSTKDFLKNALTLKGRLFVTIGKAPVMEAMIITRLTENSWSESKIFETLRPSIIDVKEPDTFHF